MNLKTIASRFGLGALGLVAPSAVLAVGALGGRGGAQFRSAHARAIASPRGIDELRMVRIGGIDQWIHIRGEDVENPILLYVHGGPGTSMTPFEPHFQAPLEHDFTVVEWDQRGAGKTYVSNGGDRIAPTPTFDQKKADAHELTAYFKTRFKRPKIFMLGRSWGSILGLPVALEAPDDYYAFIGTGVVVDFRLGEAVGYRHVLWEARRRGDGEAVKALEAIAPDPDPDPVHGARPVGGLDRARVLRDDLARYGFAMASANVSDFSGLQWTWLSNAVDSPQYGLRDLASFVTAGPHIYDKLHQSMDGYDVRALGMKTSLLLLFVVGDKDWQTPWPVAKRYIDDLDSPYKAFYLMENAGHAGPADRPELFAQILRAKVRSIAFGQYPSLDAKPSACRASHDTFGPDGQALDWLGC